MTAIHRVLTYAFLIVSIGLLLACTHTPTNKIVSLKLTPAFPTQQHPSTTYSASIIASPLAYKDAAQQPHIIVPTENGRISALNADNGQEEWQLQLPVVPGQEAELIATPIIVADQLVVSYQTLDHGTRNSHKLLVIDLTTGKLNNAFQPLTLSASKPSSDDNAQVTFAPAHAYSHAALKRVTDAKQHPLIYLGFGNASDVQPFHGWLFEVDLTDWRDHGVDHAIKNVLLTTPEAKCPVKMEYGTQEMVCGGGIWTPSGIAITGQGEESELLITTGNGQVDLARKDYANALLRMKPGLQFDAGCDATLCANFNPVKPSEACLASCKNLFIPRLAPGNLPIKPPYHECDDKDFWECLAWMDYDLGANTPVKLQLHNGQSVIIQAGKDGGAYLIDAEHLGIQYDRLQVAKLCGSPTDLCKLSWAGMIVTQPVVTQDNGMPIVIIPTFSADNTNSAGLVALTVSLSTGKPTLKRTLALSCT
ncbi:hypothetical protein [Methylocucumis oryzae]|uniref:hypothetical protein n=1 Tax=Methylocucumis oryzae TaxID=1632867 RepID=UPI001EF9F020|nr:hypothetical protein [Methylocucumis oryzae]